MALIAKPILKNKSWLVFSDGNKIGNLNIASDGYHLNIGNGIKVYDSTTAIQKLTNIKFLNPPKIKNDKNLVYAKWPTNCKTFNDIFDLKNKVHLFTRTKKSKCFYAAGWFNIKINNSWKSYFCPKYIYITRYDYNGPYLTECEASNKIDKYNV